jgi:hypothetical protein
MTKRRTRTTEPKELGPDPVDITGKEPVLVRDWDTDTIVRAIRLRQQDIIEAELEWLLRMPAWKRPATKTFIHVFDNIPADIAEKTLAMCRLDNIPVLYQQPWPQTPWATNE